MEFRFIRGNCKFIVFKEKREESDYKPRKNVTLEKALHKLYLKENSDFKSAIIEFMFDELMNSGEKK
jgi:hypothetical protein